MKAIGIIICILGAITSMILGLIVSVGLISYAVGGLP